MIFPVSYRAAEIAAADLAAHEAAASPHTGAVAKSLYDANTILAATSDNTPVAVTIAEDRIVGRLTGGNIASLTAAQIAALITLGDLSDVGTATPTNGHVLQGNGTSWGNAALAASLPEPGGTADAGKVPVATGTGQASTWTTLSTSDADAIHDNVAGEIGAITAKTTPKPGDKFLLEDGEDSGNKKSSDIADLPGAILLTSQTTAIGAAISQHTTASADRTTATRAWNFVCDGVLFDGIWGTGGWKLVLYCRGKTQAGGDEFKWSLYDVDAASVIGSDTATVVGTSYADFAVEWTSGLPTTRKTLNVAYYNNPGSTGHLSYINGFQVYATRQ